MGEQDTYIEMEEVLVPLKTIVTCSVCKMTGHDMSVCPIAPTKPFLLIDTGFLPFDHDPYMDGDTLTKLDCPVLAYIKHIPTLTAREPVMAHQRGSCPYQTVIDLVRRTAIDIPLHKEGNDGRIDSAIKEGPFLDELGKRLLLAHPDWVVERPRCRSACDIIINDIRFNLKITDCRSPDNAANKASFYYSITGRNDYAYSSNWNDFLNKIMTAKENGHIKTRRDIQTEYHYLVKHKTTGQVLCKAIFDIHTYVSNASNDMQIHWGHEFRNSDHATLDEDYHKKVESLLLCLQRSVRMMIERSNRFAETDFSNIFAE